MPPGLERGDFAKKTYRRKRSRTPQKGSLVSRAPTELRGGGGGKLGGAGEGDAKTLSSAREAVALYSESAKGSAWRMGPPGLRNVIAFAAARNFSRVSYVPRITLSRPKGAF